VTKHHVDQLSFLLNSAIFQWFVPMCYARAIAFRLLSDLTLIPSFSKNRW